MRDVVSPRQLALALGMSESSIKRWCDEGKLEAGRTAGGHRRISRDAAIRFVRLHKLPVVDPVVLGLPDTQLPESAEDRVEQLIELLEKGETFACRTFLVGLYLAGESIARIADHVLRPALERIGEMYLERPDGVWVEHRASQIAWVGVLALAELLPRPEADAPFAVGGAPAGDPYQLPSLLVSIVLTELGWRTEHLGPDTPIEVLRQAIDRSAGAPRGPAHPSAERYRPRLAWLSVTSEPSPEVRRQIVELASDLEGRNRGCALVVGGRSHGALGLKPSPTVRLGRCFEDLTDLARRL